MHILLWPWHSPLLMTVIYVICFWFCSDLMFSHNGPTGPLKSYTYITSHKYPMLSQITFILLIFSARCNVYISRLCYNVSVCLSAVCPSVCDRSALAQYS